MELAPPARQARRNQASNLLATITTVLSAISAAKSVLPTGWLISKCSKVGRVRRITQPNCVFTFFQYNGSRNPDSNFEQINLYLSKHASFGAQRVTVTQPRRSARPVFALSEGETVRDGFQGVHLEWTYLTGQHSDVGRDCSFSLSLRRKHKHIVSQYLQHIKSVAEEMLSQSKQLQVFNNGSNGGYNDDLWEGQPFKHPASFANIALDSQLKRHVLTTLDRFRGDAEYYHRTGRAHKMGIFLFGPPGTGKTTFIAALANHMHYNLYDLDLSSVYGDKELRELFSQIPDRTVIVIEDIDAFALPNRAAKTARRSAQAARRSARATRPSALSSAQDSESDSCDSHYDPTPVEQERPPYQQKVTLAGLLNFADGLRSSCASQHIFVFTTNYPEKLDPALLRPGRMDLHIKLGYCTFEEFQSLCSTYLGACAHPKFAEIERCFDCHPKVAPAQITGVLHAHRDSPDEAMSLTIDLLRSNCRHTD